MTFKNNRFLEFFSFHANAISLIFCFCLFFARKSVLRCGVLQSLFFKDTQLFKSERRTKVSRFKTAVKTITELHKYLIVYLIRESSI